MTFIWLNVVNSVVISVLFSMTGCLLALVTTFSKALVNILNKEGFLKV